MFITLSLLLPFIVLFCCSVLFQLILLLLFFKLMQAYRFLQREQQHLQKLLFAEKNQIISAAKESTLQVVRLAQQNTNEIEKKGMKKARELEDNLNVELAQLAGQEKESLQTASNNFFASYRAELEEMKKAHLQQFSEMTALLEKETASLHEEVKKNVAGEYQAVSQALETYKETQKKMFEKELHARLQSMAENILGQSIDTTAQERLVLEAITEADTKGVFYAS